MLANNGLQATPTAALLITEKHLAWVSRFSWGVLRALEAESLGGATHACSVQASIGAREDQMPKHKDPLIEALREGRSYTWTLPDGGDFASMRAALKHGQTLTMSPVVDPSQVRVGDIVCVKWHQGYMTHLVQEIQGEQFLIANSVGKVNGWVSGGDILGRVTEIIDPEPRPSVPVMLEQLEAAYRELIGRERSAADEARRLLSVIDDLGWYADRIGVERWDSMPRSNKWSFEQNLWYHTRRAKDAAASASPRSVRYFIDRGKECVGLAAEILALLEPEEPE